MLLKSLKVTFRTLLRQKTYTAINILGIALGFTCCLLIGLYVQDELSYDQYHEKKDRIVRLASKVDGASYANGIAKVVYNWGDAAKKEIPEVEERCRFLFYGRTLVTIEDDRFYQSGGMYADTEVFEMFNWPLVKGETDEVLKNPNSIVLTESFAQRCFGDKNPIGESISFDNENQYQVTGLMKDIPQNSHFTFPFLVSMNSYSHPALLDWERWTQFYTYLLLRPETDYATVATKFDLILDKHLSEERAEVVSPLLQPITDIHLHSKLHREMATNSDILYVYIFGIIALFILVIACLNFVNLATARASTRAKEVGVRKVNGASRWSLMQQFVGESLLVAVIGAGLSIFLAQLALSPINAFLGKQLTLDWMNNPSLTFGLLGITAVAGIFSGAYPALVLSSFRPEKVIKGQISFSSNPILRKGLVVFQFSIAILLIIAALTVNNQLEYIQNKNLGFQKDQVIVVSMPSQETLSRANTMKEAFSNVGGVEMISISANRPGGSDYGVPYQAVGKEADEQPAMRCLVIDPDFIDTYGMEMAAGRNFSKDMPTDTATYLINEEAARQLGWENPLEQQLSMPAVGRDAAPIVGVVKDFHFRSLHEPIAPLYFFMQPSWFSQFSIKLKTKDIDKTLATLEQKWAEFEPNYPFIYSFFDQQFDSLHQAEAATASLVRWFTFIAIFISCLGLFGLSTFSTQQRFKEIGIRKVLGASVSNITVLLSKDFLVLVVLALIIASPLAWYLMDKWLEGFAYSINLNLGVFIMAGLTALGIAAFTVSFQSIRAALGNPIESLRRE